MVFQSFKLRGDVLRAVGLPQRAGGAQIVLAVDDGRHHLVDRLVVGGGIGEQHIFIDIEQGRLQHANQRRGRLDDLKAGARQGGPHRRVVDQRNIFDAAGDRRFHFAHGAGAGRGNGHVDLALAESCPALRQADNRYRRDVVHGEAGAVQKGVLEDVEQRRGGVAVGNPLALQVGERIDAGVLADNHAIAELHQRGDQAHIGMRRACRHAGAVDRHAELHDV